MKLILLALSLTSTIALAETATFAVEGMHCSGCKKMISAKVCENEAIAKTAESCEVTLVDEKKQQGQVVIVTKKDTKIDVDAVKAGVKAAGEDYKVTKVELKEMITQDLAAENKVDPVNSTTETTTTTVEKETTDHTGHTTKEIKKTKKIVRKALNKKDAKATTTTEPITEEKKETK